LEKPAGAIEIYTPEELRLILSRVPEVAIPYVAIGAFAGLRAAETARLDWSEVNLERGFITVAASKAKTAARRLVPISGNLKVWLQPRAMKSGPVVALCASRINQILSERDLPRKRNALRHSYISYRLAVVHDTPRVALECGNNRQSDYAGAFSSNCSASTPIADSFRFGRRDFTLSNAACSTASTLASPGVTSLNFPILSASTAFSGSIRKNSRLGFTRCSENNWCSNFSTRFMSSTSAA